MVVYDLRCSQGHVFESWFPDSATFQQQADGAELACPVCGDGAVVRAPIAPNVITSKSQGRARSEAADIEYTKQAMKALTNARAYIEKNCENVGDRFPEEARKIHYGEADKRNIWGEASQEEAESLREEGVEFGEIPFSLRRNDA